MWPVWLCSKGNVCFESSYVKGSKEKKILKYIDNSIIRALNIEPFKIRHGEPKFKCDLCDYKSYMKHPFEIHMRKHYGEKPFKCDQCDFATHSDSNLQSHKRNRHIEKPFKCEFCDYGAVKDSDLQRHMRQFHTMERPFKCDQCDYAGSSLITLRRHKVGFINILYSYQ